VEQPLTPAQMAELVPRGRELARAGDCFGCHSTANGPMAAGGVPIPTPFGTIFSPNITPDRDHGIGNYSRADFHRVIRDGIAPRGNLYPAMPFVFTHITRPEDIDALYAYLMTVPPIPQSPPANTGVFVLPVRSFMNFWALLNFPNREAPNRADRSADWNRGAYLVEGLGHCGACHSPRNFMLGVDFSRALEGGQVDGLDIPPLTATALAARSYDVPSLTRFLTTGISAQGTSFNGMHTVTHFSTSAMEPADVTAIATFLLTGPDGRIVPPSAPPAPLAVAENPAPGSPMAAGRILYVEQCSGCHGQSGEGIPNVAPALRGNSTVAMAQPRNLLNVVVNGIPTQTFTGMQRMYAMPPFAHRLTAEQIAELTAWVRAEWGGQNTPIGVEAVTAVTRAVD
jgi:mono/diheme cytochrome c family protein